MLLNMVWRGELYVDGALPFGAQKLFTTVADGLLWCMGRHGVTHAFHYLDDFLVMGEGDSDQCDRVRCTSLALCQMLGFPIADYKVEGPSVRLPFLDILIDTESCTLKLAPEKLRRLHSLIRQWVGRRSCTKRVTLPDRPPQSCLPGSEGWSYLPKKDD